MARGIARPAVVLATAGLVVFGLAAPALATPSASSAGAEWQAAGLTGPGHVVHFGSHGEVDVNVCSEVVRPGYAHCDAHVRADLFGKNVGPLPPGAAQPRVAVSDGVLGDNGAYSPAYLQSAYNAPSSTAGTGQTVAIVDAYDAPNVESDLATYRSQFGLPACTTANGCFDKVNQTGGKTYPTADSGWAQEISLDVDMVSALCPNCHILLVEASSSSFLDLGDAENEAVALGANVVSNSYGGSEFSDEAQADSEFYDHPGVAIVASTGDNGYGVNYPAASPDVVAVGGTSLLQQTQTGTRDATETVWSGAGSGCSAFEAKPAWQHDDGCTHRTVADVAAVADPNTGVWVYDAGWKVFGGTSVASPIVGALFGLAGNPASSDDLSSYPYSHLSSLNDIVSGNNGSCGGSYLCTGSVGYDGPTGLGTIGSVDALTPPSGPATPPPDFSLTAAPIAAFRDGSSATSHISLTAENGYSGSVHLSATVSPATGLSTSFSPAATAVGAVAGSSTLTVTGHAGGVYHVTVKATQGALIHTRVLTVTVNDFSLKATPASQSIARGKVAHYTVTLTRQGAFSQAATLSVTGLRTHDKVAYSANPAPVSSAQTITITTSKLDAAGTLTLDVTATSGVLHHTVVVKLVLQ